MKKSITLLTSLCLVLSLFAGCGNSSPESTTYSAEISTTAPTPETTAPEITLDAGINTDETLFTVEITLPASMFEGEDMSAFDADAYAAENGFISAVVNEDSSITVTMTKAKHRELIDEMAASLDASFSEFIEAESTPYIKNITRNDDFSSISVEVVREDYENAWDMTAFSVGISAMIFQSFLDVEPRVEVSFVDVDTNEIFNTVVFPIESE